MLRETCFERAIFFSWYCETADCKFCYMSVGTHKKIARRRFASILAEVFLSDKLGWHLGFISGGHNAYTTVEFKDLLRNIYEIHKDKIWVNIGPLNEDEIKSFLPYIKGVVGSIETININLHDDVCPSKPIKPFEDMFKIADKYKLEKAMTIILGLGETIEDYNLLRNFIKKYKISKIHFYALNPQKNTSFENIAGITKEYHAKWIKKTREDFPEMDIQAGIWLDKVDNVSYLLKAGANSISKFPAIKYFNSKYAKKIEEEAKKAGRIFKGTLTKFPRININEIDKFKIDNDLKKKIKIKLDNYLIKMKK